MSTDAPSKSPDGKPTIQQDNHDQNIGQREATKSRPDEKTTGETPAGAKETGGKESGGKETGGKETIEQDERGGNYGQREGSTISEDNDVE